MNANYYLADLFDYRDKPLELGDKLEKNLLPLFYKYGFRSRLYESVYGLGNSRFWLITATNNIDTSTSFPLNKLKLDPEWIDINSLLQSNLLNHRSLLWKDFEPTISWPHPETYPMLHLETFNYSNRFSDCRDFFLHTALPYLRAKGLSMKFLFSFSSIGR